MPKQKPGKSKQDYETPEDFLRGLESRFGPIVCDLAATASKVKSRTGQYYGPPGEIPTAIGPPRHFLRGEMRNAINHSFRGLGTLAESWSKDFPIGHLYCNPEYRNIAPYVAKAWEESRKREGVITFLIPASIGTVWFDRYVRGKAMVLGINRVTFVGETITYPKDLMVLAYGYGMHGFDTWRWDRPWPPELAAWTESKKETST